VVRIYLEQHRGIWNKEPGSFHQTVGKRLFEYLKEKMGIKDDLTTKRPDVMELLRRLQDQRLRHQGENLEEANNP
jgi:hypothetical protein